MPILCRPILRILHEAEIGKQTPALLRCAEAEYFFDCFVISCGPPGDCYFQMISFFDAFLFCIASVEDLVDSPTKETLKKLPEFRLAKALRNLTCHHSILAAPLPGAKFERPFARHIDQPIGSLPNNSARLRFKFDVLRRIMDRVLEERPNEKKTFDYAWEYIESLKTASGSVFVDSVMSSIAAKVRSVVN